MNEIDEVGELKTFLGALAEMLGIFRAELLKNGFNEVEATELCMNYMDIVMGPEE